MTPYLEILKDWNFWENKIDLGTPRNEYVDRLENQIDLPEIVGLYGVRRSGKSTILLQLIERVHVSKKIPYKNFLYVNFEDPRFDDNFSAKDMFVMLEEYEKNIKPKGRIYLFLDEIQRVKKWERFVLTMYEQKRLMKIFVTGSSSSLLDSDLSSLLSGRMLLTKVLPLTFSEFLKFKKSVLSNIKVKLELFDEYLMYGGFPRVVLEPNEINKRAILTSYYNSILEKDVILRNRIKKREEIKSLARYIMSNNGSLLSTYALEKTLGLSSVNISKYVRMMVDSFLIFENNFFSYSVKKQIYNPSKIYSVDTGLSNIAGFNFSENKGRLLENVVNNTLVLEGKEIFYWKNSTEIDFVVFENKAIKELINVTMTVDDPNVLKRELNSLDITKKELKVKNASLLTLYNESKQKDEKITNLLKFLKAV